MKKGTSKGAQQFKSEQRRIEKTFDEAYLEYINGLKIKGRSEETLRTYANHKKYFSGFLGSKKMCSDITEETINSYIGFLQIKNIKPTTINSYIHNISPVIKYCVKQGYIQKDFMIPVVKGQEEFKEILTEEELFILLQKPKKKEFASVRTYTIIWLLASTGIRATELRNLKIKNVDISNRSIACNNTKNKKARYLPISSSLQKYLRSTCIFDRVKVRNICFPLFMGTSCVERLFKSQYAHTVKNVELLNEEYTSIDTLS